MAWVTNFPATAAAIALCLVIGGALIEATLDLAPSPAEQIGDFLYNCSAQLTPDHCGTMIASEMLFGNVTTSFACCTRLVGMGKNCHTELVKNYLSRVESTANATRVWRRSDEVWGRCLDLWYQYSF
ncbi:hypothetical protein U1Q18_029207 [Sarracenia purpurea var. burkii]